MTARRYTFLLLIFAVLAVLAAVPPAARAEGQKVAVFPIKNNGQAQYNGMASGLSAMITNNLNRSENLDVIEPQRVMDSLSRARLAGGAPDVGEALRAAQSLGADYAVTGTFLLFGGKFRIDITVYDVAKGSTGFVDKAQASEQEFFDKVDELSDRILIKLAGSLPKAGGGITVGSTPQGASITLDGGEAGETPAVFEKVDPGSHVVELELYGYKPFSATVNVAAGEMAVLDAELVPLNGGIRVWWKYAPSSDVQIGGDIVPAASFRFDADNPPRKYCRNLPAGEYGVSIRMPYKNESSWDVSRVWKTYSTDIEVRPGEVTDVYIYNYLFSPSLDVSVCDTCAQYWDFDTGIVWYEQADR